MKALFLLLAVYGLLVWGYIWKTYWSSPEYQAAEHVQAAADLLGLDDGRSATKEALLSAFTHYLEAARLMPRVKQLHERVEAMRWRMDERHFKLGKDMEMRAEAVAMLWQNLQQEHEPLLVMGARDRGWVPSQLLEGPTSALLWSLPGFVLIVMGWGFVRYSAKRVRAADHEAQLRALEGDVAQLEAQRRPPKTRR